MLQCRNTFTSASCEANLVGMDAAGKSFDGAWHEPSSSATADLALTGGGQRHGEWVGKQRRHARNVKKELKWTLISGFYVADSQRKYFSTGWIWACLLRCNQTPLRLPWAFKELAGTWGIHMEKKQFLSKLDVNVVMVELFTVSFDNIIGCSLLRVFPVFQLLTSFISATYFFHWFLPSLPSYTTFSTVSYPVQAPRIHLSLRKLLLESAAVSLNWLVKAICTCILMASKCWYLAKPPWLPFSQAIYTTYRYMYV